MFSRRAAAYIQGSDCVRSRTESGSGTLYVLRPRTAHHNGANHYGLVFGVVLLFLAFQLRSARKKAGL